MLKRKLESDISAKLIPRSRSSVRVGECVTTHIWKFLSGACNCNVDVGARNVLDAGGGGRDVGVGIAGAAGVDRGSRDVLFVGVSGYER